MRKLFCGFIKGGKTFGCAVAQAGTYSVTIDDCAASVQVLEASISPSNPVLCNGSALLTASGPSDAATFTWGSSTEFDEAPFNIGPFTNVTNLTIGSTGAFVHAHYGTVSFSIDLYNPATGTWVTVYSSSTSG